MKTRKLLAVIVLALGISSPVWAAKKINSANVGTCVVKNVKQKLGTISAAVDTARVWSAGAEGTQKDLDYIVKNQSALDKALKESEAKAIENGAPPADAGSGRRAFSNFVERLPAAAKQNFVFDLLMKNGTTPEMASHIIESLEPEEGVGEAVVKYLSKSGFLMDAKGKPDFTDEQIQKMFAGKRFQKFFPWTVENTSLDVNAREKLLLAVRTSPLISLEDGLDPAILGEGAVDRKHFDTVIPSSAVRQTLEYDPLVLPRILKDELNADFHMDGLTQDQQIRGLIVQGHYEKNGDSLYVDFSAKRGVADIESDVPKINRALRDNLETGILSKEPPLYQRLFAYNWSMNSNPSLIASLRQTALRVAEQDPAFKPLRIEIHAFPTADLYSRVEAYVVKYKAGKKPNPRAIKYMDQCLEEMQAVLGIGKNARKLSNILDDFKAPKSLLEQLDTLTEKFENLPVDKKLDMISTTRTTWHDERLQSGTASDHFDYYAGDRELALMSMRLEKQMIDKLPKDPQKQLDFVEHLGGQIINQVRQDNFITDTQASNITRELHLIAADSDIAPERKLELISDLLNNSVDQVYYALKRPFGELDERILRMAAHGASTTPIRFLDGTLRSNNVFMLSQLVDAMEESALARKNISHFIGSTKTRISARVFNPGKTVGVLRLNKNPMELTSSEIGVFSEMPTESGAVGGIVTLGVGARLSHMQLLARSLKIPNVKFSNDAIKLLKPFDGQMVSFNATKEGAVEIIPLGKGAAGGTRKKLQVKVPVPDHSITKPVTFDNAVKYLRKSIAGPKGMTLVKLRTNPKLRDSVPDGFMLPFGFFRRYLKEAGIEPLVDTLGKIDQTNTRLVAQISRQIQDQIFKNPIPDTMLAEIMDNLEKLQKRTGHKAGYFFRSDTNIEDLPGFNGAGLNESVANVKPEEADVQQAVRTVWASPFKEKSIFWRGLALGTPQVPLAEPSIVVMPTVFAKSSGVIISKGTSRWKSGKGYISANWGIGSVVEAGAPVEEITLEGENPLRFAFTSSNVKPTASKSGGLKNVPIEPGNPVLTDERIKDLSTKANEVEKTLGQQPKGFDIEWANQAGDAGEAKDASDTSHDKEMIVQARPNT